MTREILIVGLATAIALVGINAEARTCRGDASGSSTTSIEIDSDMNADLGSIGSAAGTDSCNGRFTADSAGELAEWDQVTYCDFDEYGTPAGVKLLYLSFSQVVRYRKGDLLFQEQDDSQPSWFCYHFDDPNSSTYEVHSVITGGTGRFEGASGSSVGTGRSYSLNNMGAFSGTFVSDFVSEDTRPPRSKHDD